MAGYKVTQEQNDFIAENYKSMTYVEIAKEIGLTPKQTRGRAMYLGLRKYKERADKGTIKAPKKTIANSYKKMSEYNKRAYFAKQVGFENIPQAISKMGGCRVFSKRFKKFNQSLNIAV